MKKKFNQVVIGGTFDEIHVGHMAIILSAFEIGKTVLIGLTSDKYIMTFKKNKNLKYDFITRFTNLENLLRKFSFSNYKIISIDDPFGPTTESKEIDAIITSEETSIIARKINEIRRIKNLPLLHIIEIGMILSDDGKPVSSTRIRNNEINSIGRII